MTLIAGKTSTAGPGPVLLSLMALLFHSVGVTAFGGRTQYIEIIRPVLPSDGDITPLLPEPPIVIPNIQPIQPYVPVTEIQGPRKRSAIVIDKLMYALQKALDGKDRGTGARIDSYASIPDLQRRTTGDTRLYWRCYFNAVSCF